MIDAVQLQALETVSVVIPTHNRAQTLPRTLESVWEQTFRPIELILVDDGSTDATAEVVSDWAAQHEEAQDFVVRSLYQENAGANAARNRGIRAAQGAYVAFLDSDDRWRADKLAKQIAVLRQNERMGDVYCGLTHVDLATGQPVGEAVLGGASGDLLRELLVRDVTGPTSCHLLRREVFDVVGCFDESLPARQDWDMWIRVASAYQIGCVPEPLVEMGEHTGERVGRKALNELQGHRRIFEKYAGLRAKQPLWVRLAARSAMYRRHGRVYFHRGISRWQGIGYELLAILTWPLGFDSYAALAGMLLPRNLRERLHRGWNRIFGRTLLAIRSH
jgi:glycosyltransferase involved in cell wall biosynthesis